MALRDEDVMPIMHWRNAQLSFLRQREPLTPAQQQRYFEPVVEPSYAAQQPQQICSVIYLGLN